MTTQTSPAGLARFQKAIPSKYSGKLCFFCGTATQAGVDFAALDNGQWLTVCALHASSTVEQSKALIKLIQAEAVTYGLTADDLAAVNQHAPANVGDVLAGTADEYDNVACAIKLTDALSVVRRHRPATAAAVRPNKFAAKCVTCGGKVAEGLGRIAQKACGKGWDTFHLDGQCPAPTAAAPVAAPTVAEGRYALTDDDGIVKFYRVEHGAKGGKWEGFVFVSAQASDDLFPIRNRASREAILAAIALDPQAATVLYGKELGVCGRCGITLTSEWRKQGIGPVCSTKAW
jgi:hypothetical protein